MTIIKKNGSANDTPSLSLPVKEYTEPTAASVHEARACALNCPKAELKRLSPAVAKPKEMPRWMLQQLTLEGDC